MSWMDQVGSLLQQYAGIGPSQAPPNVHDDFGRCVDCMPRNALAEGIAGAFRSDRTPPFAQMVAQLFGNSNGNERAGLLNTLLQAVGPALLAQFLGGRGGGLGDLMGLLGGGGGFTPQMADQVSPQMVQQLAAQAEQQNPSVVDTLGNFYAENPRLFQSLGGDALSTALSEIAGRQRR